METGQETKQKDLSALLDAAKKTPQFDLERARAMLEKTLSQPLLPCEQEQVGESSRLYVGYWATAHLYENYPQVVSQELFELKRPVAVKDRYGDTSTIEIPSILSVDVRTKIPAIVSEKIEFEGRNDVFEMRVEVPSFTPEAREAYVEALRTSANIAHEAYEDPLIRRVLANNRDVPLPTDSTYRIIWAPEEISLRDVTPRPKDPALIQTYWGTHFVVFTWEREKERPIEAFIKEFSTSFKLEDS